MLSDYLIQRFKYQKNDRNESYKFVLNLFPPTIREIRNGGFCGIKDSHRIIINLDKINKLD